MLKVGIVGLPNAGKSTLFSAITKLHVDIANYPFATIEPNIGIIEVYDQRLVDLSNLIHPKKTTFSVIKFIDIAGLIAGASEGEGLGNLFLSHIREVDLICHVVRCFSSNDVIHVNGAVDSICDFEIIINELSLADESFVLKRIEKLNPKVKANIQESIVEMKLCERILSNFIKKRLLIDINEFTPEEKLIIKSWNLLTTKPMIAVANVNESDLVNLKNNQEFLKLVEFLNSKQIKVVPICAKTEQEINSLSMDEKEKLATEFNWNEYQGIKQLTAEIFAIMHISVFFTFGEDEVRSWAFNAGSLAPECAGLIHSDLERGFIKAEVIYYKDLLMYGSEAEAKKHGKLRIEGKDYLVSDGDVCTFRFNVQKQKK